MRRRQIRKSYFIKKKEKPDEVNRSVPGIGGVLLMGLLLFFALLYVERNALADYKTESVVVAAKEIHKNTKLTKDEIESAFEEIAINSRNVSEGGFKTKEEMIAACKDAYVIIPIAKNSQMNLACIKKQEEYEENLQKPVEAGCKVSSSDLGLGGMIREGDLVDVSIVAPNETMTGEEKIFGLEDVWVARVFDNNGAAIEATDQTSIGVGFNLVIEEEALDAFTKAMQKGKIYLSRKVVTLRKPEDAKTSGETVPTVREEE